LRRPSRSRASGHGPAAHPAAPAVRVQHAGSVGIAKSLSARMLLFSAAAAVLLAAAFIVLILATHTSRDAGREALRSQKAITAGEVLEKSVLSLDNGLRAFIINGRPGSLEPYRVAKR